MRKIKIEITKARIESYTATFNEDNEIALSTTIGLYTDGGKKITSYSISTESWSDNTKIELPLGVIAPIQEIGSKLEEVATLHCRRGQLALTS